ncbi:16S rRNA (guanine(966)-N(2))-methyltransferase RsmD [Candidatus Bipolaricaulota bacterium]|nr:16S rRNA (guanine(966)-N(2))-methyltransferase RsmD [Candidatus Bipolaricaulota bacterium]
MHIIGGQKKGHSLFGPGPKDIRPIQHLVRKALFDMIRQLVEGARFLDLFAGTGSVGLEALSRGTRNCTFVDRSQQAISLISKNLEKLDYTDRAVVEKNDVGSALEKYDRRARRFDIAFVGPPYETNLATTTLEQLNSLKVIRPGGVIIVEVFHKDDLPGELSNLNQIDSREYGQTKLAFYRLTRD